MQRMHAFLFGLRRWLALALVWFALTGPDPAALLPGLAAVSLGTWLSLRLLPPACWLRLWRVVLLLPGFLWRSLLGALDVAVRALHPRLPLAPGWVEVPCRLPGAGRVALGGSFSLMPGTLAAGARGGRLLVHCLDSGQPVAELIAAEERAYAQAIAAPKEPVAT